MKVTNLKVRNVGPIGELDLAIDKPLLIFYGEIRQGKTTILNAVRWACGLPWPEDIIKHGAKEAEIELGLDGGVISRSWYRNKEGVTTARAVQFVRNGKPVPNPTYELKRVLNPFVVDQDYLKKMTDGERKKFFAEFFAVDTAAIDSKLFNVTKKASDLRAKLTGYGEIDTTEVQKADENALRAARTAILDEHDRKKAEATQKKSAILSEFSKHVKAVQDENEEIAQSNRIRKSNLDYIETCEKNVAELRAEIERVLKAISDTKAALEDRPATELKPLPNAPDVSALDAMLISRADTSELDKKLQDAAAQNVRYEQYQKNLIRAKARDEDEAQLKELEKQAKETRQEKVALLAKTSETCGVPGLVFDETGSFTYEGVDGGMLSTSQLMKLSSAISALYPEGLSLELLDRGESLGKSIFDYIEHAKSKKVSVLATVVGQKPANVPENVGVFVVQDGVVIP